MKKIKLVLADSYVRDGITGSCGSCPIALMMAHYLKPEYSARIGNLNLSIGKKHSVGNITYHTEVFTKRLPPEFRDFIARFDRLEIDYYSYAPIEVEMEFPEEMLKESP